MRVDFLGILVTALNVRFPIGKALHHKGILVLMDCRLRDRTQGVGIYAARAGTEVCVARIG